MVGIRVVGSLFREEEREAEGGVVVLGKCQSTRREMRLVRWVIGFFVVVPRSFQIADD